MKRSRHEYDYQSCTRKQEDHHDAVEQAWEHQYQQSNNDKDCIIAQNKRNKCHRNNCDYMVSIEDYSGHFMIVQVTPDCITMKDILDYLVNHWECMRSSLHSFQQNWSGTMYNNNNNNNNGNAEKNSNTTANHNHLLYMISNNNNNKNNINNNNNQSNHHNDFKDNNNERTRTMDQAFLFFRSRLIINQSNNAINDEKSHVCSNMLNSTMSQQQQQELHQQQQEQEWISDMMTRLPLNQLLMVGDSIQIYSNQSVPLVTLKILSQKPSTNDDVLMHVIVSNQIMESFHDGTAEMIDQQ